MRKLLTLQAFLVAGAIAAAALPQTVRAADPIDIAAAVESTSKSLVIVDYTFRNENGSTEASGQGIVLTADGLVAIPGSMLPELVPMSYVKDLVIRTAGNHFSSVPAQYLGRSPNGLMVLLKATKPLDAPPLDLSKTQPYALGEEVFSVGVLPKARDYQPYLGITHVRGMLPTIHPVVFGESFSLTRPNSPVFDSQTGALVGITAPPTGDTMSVNTEKGPQHLEMRNDDQPGVFVPIADMLESLDSTKVAGADGKLEYPHKPFTLPRPWVGIDGITGLTEDLRNLYNIKERVGIVVGSAIPGQPADKAGLKPRDIITGVDGKPFVDTAVPEFMSQQFSRIVEHTHVGDTLQLTVLRPVEGSSDVQTLKLPLIIAAFPQIGSQMPLTYNSKLGITTRDVVFVDTYARKLPADTKGAVVTLVKSGAPASQGSTPVRPNLIITKVNDTPVENSAQFNQLLVDATAPDKKEVVLVALDPHGDTQVLRVDLTVESAGKSLGAGD